jgi:hypothetical protein
MGTDEVFEAAMAVRETYCASVASMGKGLKAIERSDAGKSKPPNALNFNTMGSHTGEAPKPKPQTSDIGVGTEDLPFPAPDQSSGAQEGSGGKEAKASPKQLPPDVDEGSDIVAVAFGTMVSFLLWIVWTVLVTVPTRIVSFTLLFFIAISVASMIWLQLVESHGPESVGAGIDFMYNRPGIV